MIMQDIVLKDSKREFTILLKGFPHKQTFMAQLVKLFKFFQYDTTELSTYLEQEWEQKKQNGNITVEESKRYKMNIEKLKKLPKPKVVSSSIYGQDTLW